MTLWQYLAGDRRIPAAIPFRFSGKYPSRNRIDLLWLYVLQPADRRRLVVIRWKKRMGSISTKRLAGMMAIGKNCVLVVFTEQDIKESNVSSHATAGG
jgi:hypothetical protein